jgi:nucleotide-binding universal stress UspA family protein
MKILVAIDGSDRSLAALDALVERLQWFAAPPTLDLVFVHPPLPYPGAVARIGKEAVERYYDEEAEAALAGASSRLERAGVASQKVKLVGEPAQEIARHAASGGYDLIALGTHGHTALSNLVLGSTATKVIASTKIPVLLLR